MVNIRYQPQLMSVPGYEFPPLQVGPSAWMCELGAPNGGDSQNEEMDGRQRCVWNPKKWGFPKMVLTQQP